MAPEVQRVRYFTGEFLQEADFEAEQAYHMRMRYLHNRWMHTWGIANGLEVTAGTGLTVIVGKGMALVSVVQGEEIAEFQGEEVAKELVLTDEMEVSLPSGAAADSQYYIVASHSEQAVESDGTGETRWLEQPAISALLADSSSPPDNETTLILAKVQVNSGATAIAFVDSSERRVAGVRGEVEATKVQLPVGGVDDPTLWPTLRGGAASRLDLAGSLNIIDGNLDVAGSLNITNGNITLPAGATVTGRDVSVDGANLDDHLDDANTTRLLHVTEGDGHDHTGGNGAPIPWSALTNVPDFLVKAYASINSVLETPTILRSHNVISVQRDGTGVFTVGFEAVPFPAVFVTVQTAETVFAFVIKSSSSSATISVMRPDGTLADPTRLNIFIL